MKSKVESLRILLEITTIDSKTKFLICGESEWKFETSCDMDVLYGHKKDAFNCKLSFPTLLTLIENSSFHFMLIFDGVVISSKTRDDSTI